MSDVTRILSQIESGDANAASDLLPLVYWWWDDYPEFCTAFVADATSGADDMAIRYLPPGPRVSFQAWDPERNVVVQ
jgi:hypothetical protein